MYVRVVSTPTRELAMVLCFLLVTVPTCTLIDWYCSYIAQHTMRYSMSNGRSNPMTYLCFVSNEIYDRYTVILRGFIKCPCATDTYSLPFPKIAWLELKELYNTECVTVQRLSESRASYQWYWVITCDVTLPGTLDWRHLWCIGQKLRVKNQKI